MRTIAVIGGQGTGKTTFCKTLVRGVSKPVYVYDVNNEYAKGVELPEFESFCELMTTKTNSLIIFEEATIFLDKRGTNKQITEMLVRKRHTNNMIVLVFHSLRSLPVSILDLIDAIVLFKTNDTHRLLNERYKYMPELYSAFDAVYKSPNKHANKIIKLR